MARVQAAGPARLVVQRPLHLRVIQRQRGDREWPALEAWSAGVSANLEPSAATIVMPPEGVGSIWFRARSPVAPPSIIRIHVIAIDDSAPADQPNVIDQMSFNWFPETGGAAFDERYRLELRHAGPVTAAIAFTDLHNDRFKSGVWHVNVTRATGPPAFQARRQEPQPEYVVTGTASSAGPGGTNFFFSGAGHDVENTGYIDGFRRAFAAAGIGGFTDVNVSSGTRAFDATSTMALFQGPTQQTPAAATSVAKALSAARAPVARGQRNLIGYSFGGGVAAAVARLLADQGVPVDNVVLIGTAISIQFVRGLQISRGVRRVIVVNLPGDVVRPGTNPTVLQSVLDPLVGERQIEPHFFFAEGERNQPRREQLARLLFELGLR